MIRQLAVRYFAHYLIIGLVLLALPYSPIFAQEESVASDEPAQEGRSASFIGERRIGAATSILDFERFGVWRRGDERWGTFTQSEDEVSQGSYAGKFSYGFPAVPDNYIVFRQRSRIPSRPNGLRMQVYGDGSTHFLNAWIEDANRQRWQFTFGRIEHTGWQPMYASLELGLGWPNEPIGGPNELDFAYPLHLVALVLDGHSAEQGSQGVVYVDELEAITFADQPYISDSLRPDQASERPITLSNTVGTVTVERLNIREGPDTRFPVIVTVTQGELLPVLASDTTSGWLQVATQDETGWISDEFVVLESLSGEESGSIAVPAIDASPALTTSVVVSTSLAISETAIQARSSITLTKPTADIDAPLSNEPADSEAAPDNSQAEDAAAAVDAAVDTGEDAALTGRIAFPSYAGGQYAIFVINADGSDLSWVIGQASQPAFSPDGEQLAFRNWNDDERGIAVIGSALGNAGGNAGGSASGDVRQISDRPEDGLPAWSPDNDTLVYFSRREGDRRSRIYQASVSNRNEWQIEGIGGEFPMWMPDGRILYRATRPQIALTVVDNNGENGVPLIADGEATAPAISPNGESMLFMSLRSGNWEIYQLNVEDESPRQLTNTGANSGLPTWSPDGEHIAFVTDRDGFWAIWLMRSDGSEQRELLMIPGELDPRMPDEPDYRFRGWQEERISWGQ